MDWFGAFSWIEASWLSTWVRESQSLLAFPAILTLHAIGMGFLAGTAAAIDLRIFGFAARIPVSSLEELVPVMRFGFWVNAISGLLLVIGSPTKHLTNPVFFVKLTLIALALVDMRLLLHVIRNPSTAGAETKTRAKILAAASLLLWTGSIVAGRLLYYTFTRRDLFGNPY